MTGTGLLRLIFLSFALYSSVTAYESDITSRSWINIQKTKHSDSIVTLTHTLNGSHVGGTSFRREGSGFHGGIMLTGPASRLSNFHQTESNWRFIRCDPAHRGAQTALVYCASAKPKRDCAEIFLGGTKHTVIRLPDGCGASPFARVVRFEPTSKNIPGGKRPVVKGNKVTIFELEFDYDFKAVPYKKGEAPTKMHIEISNLAEYTKNPDYGKQRSYNAWLSTFKGTSLGHEFWTLQNQNSIPINQPFSATLASLKQECNGFEMKLAIEAAGNLTGSINFGYYIAGTIFPPSIGSHYAYLDGESEVTASLILSGLVKYTFPTLTIPIVPAIGLPGLDYPGILTIGPFFEINAALTGDIALDGSMRITTGFSLPSVSISIGDGSPPQSSAQGVDFAQVRLSSDLRLSTELTLELVPQVGLGVNVFSGLVDAEVSLLPSAGLSALGEVDFNTSTHKVKKACVGLDGDVQLGWEIGGNIGPWGAAKTGVIWELKKKLWEKCFLTKPSKHKGHPKSSATKWRRVQSSGLRKLTHAKSLDVISCPLVDPF